MNEGKSEVCKPAALYSLSYESEKEVFCNVFCRQVAENSGTKCLCGFRLENFRQLRQVFIVAQCWKAKVDDTVLPECWWDVAGQNWVCLPAADPPADPAGC